MQIKFYTITRIKKYLIVNLKPKTLEIKIYLPAANTLDDIVSSHWRTASYWLKLSIVANISQ
jgi:hypothetical protein